MPHKDFDVEGIGKVTIFKRRASRSLRLTVAPTGLVRVSIPLWAPYQAGLSFVLSRRGWINSQTLHAVQAPLAHGMGIGKTRRLSLIQDPEVARTKTSVRGNEVVVWHHPDILPGGSAVQRAAEAACWRALKTEATLLLTPRVNQLAAQYGFSYRSLNFKRMKSRWGSCDQRTNIVLNIFLMQLPWDCIDYVILHELTHTRVLHHGPDFWQAFDAVLPDARRYRRTMRAHQPILQNTAKPVVA